jgi:polysaccharide export outer membrane protein
MHLQLLHRARLLAALGALVVLTGCALSPGISLNRLYQGPGVIEGLVKAEEAPPAGALTRITPELVRQQRAALAQEDATAGLQPYFKPPQPYRLGPADVVGITVWGHPEFAGGGGAGSSGTSSSAGDSAGAGAGAGSYTVDTTGKIQFPYLGEVPVAGLTEPELRARMTGLLARLLRNPQVSVSVQGFRSARVYVDGEVRNPGQKFLDHIPMTLPEAISRAGGFTPTADRSAVLITRNLKTVRVDVDRLTARGVDPNRILLEHGDTVRVANFEDEKVYVLGEVSSPGGKPLRKGRLTLHQALGEAVGVSPYSGDPRQVFVIRPTTPDKPEIYHLDVSSPVAFALAEGFDLRDRDVVFVDPVPLVRWNRVISLILPSAQAISVPRQIVQDLR